MRGTPLDPFGHARVRRVERALIGEYQALVADALRGLNAGTEGMVAELANLPDLIRGYEDVKLRDVERFRGRAQELVEQLDLTRHPMDPSPR